MKRQIIFVFLTFRFLFNLFSQQYYFKSYNVESGLPFAQVSCMHQDNQGYLWSGGYGGLSRFDGKAFLNFNRKNGLIDHTVNAICSDDSGSIYVGTNKGLSILKNQRFENFNSFLQNTNPHVTCLNKGHHSIYIGTTKGLFMFLNQKFLSVSALQNYKINCLYKNDTSQLYIGTDNGLYILGHKKFSHITFKNGLCSDKINCISSFNNKILLGTDKGLSVYDEKEERFQNYFLKDGLIDENISSLVNQNESNLWIGSASGMMLFDGNKFRFLNIENDFNSNQIRCLLTDRECNVWIGTNNGLFRHHDLSFSSFSQIKGLGNSFVFKIFSDAQDNMWICTLNNGIFCKKNDQFINCKIPGNTCTWGLQDFNGRIIIAARESLLQFQNGTFSKIDITKSLHGSYDMLYLASDSTVWVGGANGISSLKWNKPAYRQAGQKPVRKNYLIRSKNDFNVWGFCEDEKKNLYVGTYKAGLFKMENDSLINLSEKNKWGEENFFDIIYSRGKIFSATLNGLFIYDVASNSVSKITEEDGLNSELLYSLKLSNDGTYLWIGTNQGINKFNLKKYFESRDIEVTSFGKQEGFAGVECNTGGIYEDKNGTLWFGTVSGLIEHQPLQLRKNLLENETVIQNIKLLNEDTLLPVNSKLPSKLNTISFYYRGICLTNPDKVKYRKKLEGLDREWSAPTSEDYIKYSNLAPGKYIFKVLSCNNEGVWNKKETSFAFEILSPFYFTGWFITSCILCLILCIYTFFILRLRYLKQKQKEEFERKVQMSKIELKALRAQMNPHFIFNSLNAIQHYIFNSKSDDAVKYLNKFARLVRVILNNSEKPFVTVGEDLETLKLYLELEQMRFEEKFDYEITSDENVDLDYDIMPPLLMQPYVENAVLHGLNPLPNKGKLNIHLKSENGFLICSISDDGIGRQKAADIKRTMPVDKHKSFGMKITEERLKILNDINDSKLSVTITDLMDSNNKPCGTKVELYVPIVG